MPRSVGIMALANSWAAVTLTHLWLQHRCTLAWAMVTALWQPQIAEICTSVSPLQLHRCLAGVLCLREISPLLNWVYCNPFLLFCLVWRSQIKGDHFYLSTGMSAIAILSFKPAPFRPQLDKYVLFSGSADLVLFSGHPFDVPVQLVEELCCDLDDRDNLYLSIYVHWFLPDQLSELIKSTIALTVRSTWVAGRWQIAKRITAGCGDREGRKSFS